MCMSDPTLHARSCAAYALVLEVQASIPVAPTAVVPARVGPNPFTSEEISTWN